MAFNRLLHLRLNKKDAILITLFAGLNLRKYSSLALSVRLSYPASAIEYHDPNANKKPFMSHEFYRKRILDVAPRHVEFEIHNSEFKSLVKNGVEHHVVVANCSLRIETWKFSALGTNVVKFLNNDPDTPVDLGSSLKSAVSNAFVGCFKSFFMSVEQLLAVKGEKVRTRFVKAKSPVHSLLELRFSPYISRFHINLPVRGWRPKNSYAGSD